METARSRLADWFEDFWGETFPNDDDVDLFERFGIDGDEASEFMDGFATHFDVEGDSYRWYFHHREEGTNFGALLLAPPYRRVRRIPITPILLTEAIETKRWPLVYPPHQIPSVRRDIRVNQLIAVTVLVLLAIGAWLRFVR